MKYRRPIARSHDGNGSAQRTSFWSICLKKDRCIVVDLSYKPKPKEQKVEPEEIAVAVTAIALWIGIAIAFLAAL